MVQVHARAQEQGRERMSRPLPPSMLGVVGACVEGKGREGNRQLLPPARRVQQATVSTGMRRWMTTLPPGQGEAVHWQMLVQWALSCPVVMPHASMPCCLK